MKNKRNKSTNVKSGEVYSTWCKFKDEWKIFAYSLFRPFVIILLGLTILAWCLANKSNIDSIFSFSFQGIATIFAGLLGASLYDSIGKNLLSKKGLSAVRNLALVRLKIKSLSDRVEKNISVGEIKNLLSFVEKDIANATQEWNDILPDVGKIEEVYILLAEKEKELKIREAEKGRLEEKIKKEKELGIEEKKRLEKTLSENVEKISKLSLEINRLDSQTIPLTLGKTESLLRSILGSTPLGMPVLEKKCSKCGNMYIPLLDDQGLCKICELRFRAALERRSKKLVEKKGEGE